MLMEEITRKGRDADSEKGYVLFPNTYRRGSHIHRARMHTCTSFKPLQIKIMNYFILLKFYIKMEGRRLCTES
jgi:hypothetical protein